MKPVISWALAVGFILGTAFGILTTRTGDNSVIRQALSQRDMMAKERDRSFILASRAIACQQELALLIRTPWERAKARDRWKELIPNTNLIPPGQE